MRPSSRTMNPVIPFVAYLEVMQSSIKQGISLEIVQNWKENRDVRQSAKEVTNIPLVRIRLDDETSIERWCMRGFVFGGIIWMDGVGHVDAQDEGALGASAMKVGRADTVSKGGRNSGDRI